MSNPDRDQPPGEGADPSSLPIEAETTYRLVERARKGDAAAVELICRRIRPRLERWARGRLPAPARGLVDTEDIVQDVLAGAIRRLDQLEYARHHALQAYVRRCVDNRIRAELRRLPRVARPLEPGVEPVSPMPSPLEALVGRELLEQYEGGLRRLSPRDQELIVARMELGCSLADVADTVGLPSPDAARKAVKRALVRLATEMLPQARGL